MWKTVATMWKRRRYWTWHTLGFDLIDLWISFHRSNQLNFKMLMRHSSTREFDRQVYIYQGEPVSNFEITMVLKITWFCNLLVNLLTFFWRPHRVQCFVNLDSTWEKHFNRHELGTTVILNRWSIRSHSLILTHKINHTIN